MDSGLAFTIFVLPSLIAALLCAVFAYLYVQSRAPYFRAWTLGWFCYAAAYGIIVWNESGHGTALTYWCSGVLFALVPLFIFASTHMLETSDFPIRRSDVGLLVLFMLWAARDVYASGGTMRTVFLKIGDVALPVGIFVGMAGLLLICAWRFWRVGRKLHSVPFRLLACSLGCWSALLVAHIYRDSFDQITAGRGHLLGPLPEVFMGITMVMVLYESERRTVQETLLGFASLETGNQRIHHSAALEVPLLSMLDKVMAPLDSRRGLIWINDAWRRLIPAVELGLSAEFIEKFSAQECGAYLLELLGPSREKLAIRSLEGLHTGDFEDPRATALEHLLIEHQVRGFIVVGLRTREHIFGLVLVPHPHRSGFGSSQVRLLTATARQLSMTLDNYVLMQDAARRGEEFELLAEIGQVVSSRLDPDEVLRTVHRELSRLFDASTFYIAFLEGEEVRFELEYQGNQVVAKRARKATRGLTEHIIRTGEPLLIRNDLEKIREKINAVQTGPPAKCFCGVPIFMYGRAVGVMAALSYTREFVYEQRDLDVMRTAAGQVAVAMENARLFAEEQRRSRYLEFLNRVSKTAISSQEPEAMMAEIVGEIQKNFRFDHIGIGILDYASKDIEIKAEAGTSERTLGRRVPLGVGIMGRVARSGEMSLMQTQSEGKLLGILPESNSVLCVPIAYSETLLGVLNVESTAENAFAQQEVLILRTLADLLATALHNAFVFQKMQQQSITDGLTGIKTRRYFNEALQSEWKRASRSGRPFSVVLIDLDKFKTVNDTLGHLEGDLVLARIGRILEQKSRQSNVVARYGGDEFVVLMPETGVEQAQILSERLRLWIATDATMNDRQITASFGVATFPMHGATAEDILHVADMGMYHSKRTGGNRVATPEDFTQTEGVLPLRQVVNAQLESFLHRAEMQPEAIEELLATLNRLQGSEGEDVAADLVLEGVRALQKAAEVREILAAGHGETVAEYAEIIGQEMNLGAEELLDLVQAARLHDVGKILIPEQILNKEGPLNEQELRTVRMHPVMGARIVGTIAGSSRLVTWVRHHHERFDGTGYPDRMKGEAIPLGSRIISVAEAYANMCAEHCYAAKRTPAEALAELERLSGTQFDGMIVRVFLNYMKRARAVSASF